MKIQLDFNSRNCNVNSIIPKDSFILSTAKTTYFNNLKRGFPEQPTAAGHSNSFEMKATRHLQSQVIGYKIELKMDESE